MLRHAYGILLGALALSLLAAACGGSKEPAVATLGTTPSSSDAGKTSIIGSAGPGPHSTRAQVQADALKFSKCMRANGVPNFPDPSPGGGFLFTPGAGYGPNSPTSQAAQAKCQKFMPAPPGLAAGTQTHPSAQWLAQMIKAAACMRRHGYPDFPDPRTSIPSDAFVGPGGSGTISNIDGVIFIFPTSIDTTSLQFYRAADKCKFPDHGH